MLHQHKLQEVFGIPNKIQDLHFCRIMDSTPGSRAPGSFEGLWSEIEHGVREIHMSGAVGRMRFIELYSKIYNYCLSKPQAGASQSGLAGRRESSRMQANQDGDTRMDRATSTGSTHSHSVSRALYDKLELLLTDILQEKANQLSLKPGIELLQAYHDEWEGFKTHSQAVNKIFSYLNRHWIHHDPGEHREPSKPFQIYQLGLDIWKRVVFEAIKQNILKEILNEYEKDRLQLCVNAHKQMLKDVVHSYLELGMTFVVPFTDPRHPELTTEPVILDSFTQLVLDPHFYMEELEQHLLTATNEYFSKMAKNFISCNPGKVTDYMKMVETEINNEEDRARLYLPTLSFSKVLKVVDDGLIREHVEEIRNNFLVFLEQDKVSDLARTYTLVYRLGDELPPLCQIFTQHVKEQGEKIVADLVEKHEDKSAIDQKLYFEALLGVHEKFNKLAIEAFHNNTAFKSAMDMGFEVFVNTNAVTQAAGSSQKSAELLAKYSDGILRKSNRIVVEDKSLDEIMHIFPYLADKDAFQTYYSVRLANRLINNNSANDDAEQSMIERLKQYSGYEYTSKLTKMYKDMVVSKDLHTEFKEFTSSKEIALSFDFQPIILTSGSWPYKFVRSEFSLPQELEVPVNSFVEFYTTKHQGRKLIWLQNRSKGELHCSCFSEPHILQLSMYQMAILLMYNTALLHNFEEILQLTNLTPDLCSFVLETLTSSNLLTTENSVKANDFTNDTVFALNTDYKNQRHRIALPSTLVFEKKGDADKGDRRIKSDRLFILQACIVRVMKARQIIGHQELELEVMKQTHKRFHPDSAMIKKCIKLLIQKEYMKRTEDDNNKYVYIS